jgi:PKD repeat protein
MRQITQRVVEQLEPRMMLSIPATPLQSVQTSVDSSGVHLSVTDPHRNTVREHSEGLLPDETASTIQSSSGIVTWSTTRRDAYAVLQTKVFYEVYDIQKGSWQGREQELAPGESLGSLLNSGGVVAFTASDRDYYGQLNQRVFYAVYDPQKGAWREGQKILPSGTSIGSIQNSGGVVAFSASDRDYYGNRHDRVFYTVYDPKRGGWRNDYDELTANEAVSAITIANCTVSWTTSAASYTRGYDPGTGSWNSHTSRPLAFFYGGAYIGNPPSTVYLWDMSIGATSWSWNFGDGASSGTRAPSHTYSSNGLYTLTQTASNVGVSSSRSVTVDTDTVMFDLLWNSMTATPGSLTELGGSVSVKRNYRITDRAAVPDFAIQYHLSTDQVWGNSDDIVLGGDETISTDGGKSVGSHSKKVTLSIGRVAVGSYFLLANLDAAGTVSEGNETNNIIAAPLLITAPVFGQVSGKNQVMKVPDVDGDMLTFSLTGSGRGELTGPHLNILTLTGTNASSQLKITVSKASGGDGQVTFACITSDGLMKRIDGKAVIVDGDVDINTLLIVPSPKDALSVSLLEITGTLNNHGLAVK